MTTVPAPSALWMDTAGWIMSGQDDRLSSVARITSGEWEVPPHWSGPRAVLNWAVWCLGTKSPTRRLRRDEDPTVRCALLIGPDAMVKMGLPAEIPPQQDGHYPPHPWAADLEAAGWRVRTKTAHVWLTIERPGWEIGICLTSWAPWEKPGPMASYGLAHVPGRGLDPFGTVYVHGEYHRLTGWPLSAGAGVAAAKALWRMPRKSDTKITWSPSWDEWRQMGPFADGRPIQDRTQRPWHLVWSSPHARATDPAARIVRWDGNAAYLNAWSVMRVAYGRLTHTGSEVHHYGRYWPAGWYQISEPEWSPAAAAIVERLPPVWGSRTPSRGRVWVTHIIMDLLSGLTTGPDKTVAGRLTIHDSWTCAESGQIGKTWGSQLKAALKAARVDQREYQGEPEAALLAGALKSSYATGYVQLEKLGLIRRPDWLDALIDYSNGMSGWRRMWLAGRDLGRFPLAVSADEITYEWLTRDETDGPLGPDQSDAYGGYKVADRGTGADLLASLDDGRTGRWWAPVPAAAVVSAHGAPQRRTAPAAPVAGSSGSILDRLRAED